MELSEETLMLELAYIRKNPELVREAIKNKGEKADLDKILELDAARRKALSDFEPLRAEQKRVSKEIAQKKKAGEDATAELDQMKTVAQQVKELESKAKELEAELDEALRWLPNMPLADTPLGRTEEDNVEVRAWGEPKKHSFEAKAHWDIAKDHDIIDFERGAKIAGSHFALYKGDGARLERALINFMIDVHTQEHGYREVSTPFVANRASMFGTGQLPKMEDDMYHCTVDDLFLIPTAEVPITNIHQNEILEESQLPITMTGYSPCFRREAGSYGRDTRALMRVHQFDKVELVKIVEPDTSYDELEKLLVNAETILQRLGLPYRVLRLCTGELSFAAAKCYDIECWASGIGRWMEVSSCSNFEAFQARRANIRYRPDGGKVTFVHTLNGSGVALARTVLCILEHYQLEDGAVEIPEVLRPYMGGQERIG
jgi:seryl-tRNA synthetase